jgi:hypothetical protein
MLMGNSFGVINTRSGVWRAFCPGSSSHAYAASFSFLRAHVFGSDGTPDPAPLTERATSSPKAAGDGKAIDVEHTLQTLERAKADYRGLDPEGLLRMPPGLSKNLRAPPAPKSPSEIPSQTDQQSGLEDSANDVE